jgi:hypothetical protein
MKILPKEVTRTVPLLVDPEPGWMALVNYGANQTPWNSLKSKDGNRTQEHSDMATKGKGAKREGIITRMNFSKDAFTSVAAVQKFIDDNGITDLEIIDDNDIYAAKSTMLDQYELGQSVSQTTKHAGVTMYIAEVKSQKDVIIPMNNDGGSVPFPDNGTIATAPTPIDSNDNIDGVETDPITGLPHENVTGDPISGPTTVTNPPNVPVIQPGSMKGATKAKALDGEGILPMNTDAQKPPKGKGKKTDIDDTDTVLRFPANKYDWWAAYMSDEGSLLGVLDDGLDYDNIPPGMQEVMEAVTFTAGNILSMSDTSMKKAMLVQLGQDFADLTFALSELFEKATDDVMKQANNDRKAKAAGFVKSFSDSVTRASSAPAEFIDIPDNRGIPSKDLPVVNDIEVHTESYAEDGTVQTMELPGIKMASIIKDAVTAATAPLLARITEVEKTAKTATDELQRAPSRRSDQNIIDNLTNGVETTTVSDAEKAQRIDDLGRMFGIKSTNRPALAQR